MTTIEIGKSLFNRRLAISSLVIAVLSVLSMIPANAQQGPFVPCTDCDLVTSTPYPRTGLWSNPDQPGTGINIEIQDGRLAGTFYGYDDEGRPDWRIFNGRLIQSDEPDVLWELETVMSGFEGGACPGCVYQEPLESDDVIPVRLEFQQPNYLQITFADTPGQFFVPFVYGTVGKKFFAQSSDYLFPVLGTPGEGNAGSFSFFVFIYRPKQIANLPQEHLWETFTLRVGKAETIQAADAGIVERIEWSLSIVNVESELFEVGNITCSDRLDMEASLGPSCILSIVDFVDRGPDNLEFKLPAAWFGDKRIHAEGPEESTLVGFRLDYN